MTLPFVSCLCPTFGRFPAYGHLVAEAVESYLRQDYPADRRELILLNDHPSQTLRCDAPGVRVINQPGRHASLGEKYNAMIAFAAGEILAPFEDDDISLPWRLSLSVARLGEADYFNPKAYWFLCGQTLKHEQRTGYAHNCSIYRRSAWERVGGYPAVSGPQDAAMDGQLRRYCRVIDGPLSAAESVFIYRWGVSNLHLSGQRDTARAYREWGTRPVQPGTFTVIPRWQQDYVALTQQSIAKGG